MVSGHLPTTLTGLGQLAECLCPGCGDSGSGLGGDGGGSLPTAVWSRNAEFRRSSSSSLHWRPNLVPAPQGHQRWGHCLVEQWTCFKQPVDRTCWQDHETSQGEAALASLRESRQAKLSSPCSLVFPRGFFCRELLQIKIRFILNSSDIYKCARSWG